MIYTARADGTDEKQITSVDSGSPDWSPDSLKIAFDFLASEGFTDEECSVQGTSPLRRRS